MPIHPNAQQCAYTKVDGVRCGGPAKVPSDFCFHHQGLKDRFDTGRVTVPPLDDQNAIQVAIMDVVNGLLSQRLPRADANTVLYALQIARANLKGLSLVPPAPDQLAAMLEQAREEGRTEFNRTRKQKDSEDGESLAAFLLRELKAPLEEEENERQAYAQQEALTGVGTNRTSGSKPSVAAGSGNGSAAPDSCLTAAYSGPKPRS